MLFVKLEEKVNKCAYSVDSTLGELGIIINIQFVKIVVIINRENKGWTRTYIAKKNCLRCLKM